MTPHGLRGAPRFRPFVSNNLEEYLKRYWAIVFTVGSQAIDTGHMRHYLSWYATRLKVVELDHHIHALTLRDQLIAKAGTPTLPLLFVNAKLVGTIADVRSYEERRLLKDIVQFGFQWKTGASVDGAPQPLNTLPSPYRDTEIFRGRYRGAPVARPVVQLPQLHPFHNEKD
jgi:glutaredoxin